MADTPPSTSVVHISHDRFAKFNKYSDSTEDKDRLHQELRDAPIADVVGWLVGTIYMNPQMMRQMFDLWIYKHLLDSKEVEALIHTILNTLIYEPLCLDIDTDILYIFSSKLLSYPLNGACPWRTLMCILVLIEKCAWKCDHTAKISAGETELFLNDFEFVDMLHRYTDRTSLVTDFIHELVLTCSKIEDPDRFSVIIRALDKILQNGLRTIAHTQYGGDVNRIVESAYSLLRTLPRYKFIQTGTGASGAKNLGGGHKGREDPTRIAGVSVGSNGQSMTSGTESIFTCSVDRREELEADYLEHYPLVYNAAAVAYLGKSIIDVQKHKDLQDQTLGAAYRQAHRMAMVEIHRQGEQDTNV